MPRNIVLYFPILFGDYEIIFTNFDIHLNYGDLFRKTPYFFVFTERLHIGFSTLLALPGYSSQTKSVCPQHNYSTPLMHVVTSYSE